MSTKQINLTAITTYEDTEIILRNFMVASNNDIKILSNDNVIVKCYGYTLIGDNIRLVIGGDESLHWQSTYDEDALHIQKSFLTWEERGETGLEDLQNTYNT